MFEELSSMAAQMQAQNPYAQAITGIGEVAARSIARRQDRAHQDARMREIQSYLDARQSQGKRDDLVKGLMTRDYTPTQIPFGPQPEGITRMTDALAAMGIQPKAGDEQIGFQRPSPKPAAPGVVPLTQRLIDRIKTSGVDLDLSEFKDTPVRLDTINSMLNQGRQWKLMFGSGGKITPEQRARQQATQLAWREHLSAYSNATSEQERQNLPDWRQSAEVLYEYLLNQNAAKANPGPAEMMFRDMFPDFYGSSPAAPSGPIEDDGQ